MSGAVQGRIEALVRESDDGIEVLAPAVGRWSAIPAMSAPLGKGAAIGLFERLNQRFVLHLPAGVEGRIAGSPAADGVLDVEYGQPLFRLDPLASASTGDDRDGSTDRVDAVTDPVLAAPTDGVFYQRPSPDAESFVKVGEMIRTGQPVGLIEVMKTFNQILYEGNGLPDPAEVREICCEDGEEVEAGGPLIRVRAPD